MTWGSPEVLVWTWLFVPGALCLWWLVRRKWGKLLQLAQPDMLAQLAPHANYTRRQRMNLLWILGMLLLALSVARPQWGTQWEELKRRGMEIMVVLDTSKSMLATDLKPNRLQQAKWGIRDFTLRLKGDRVGLVAFAGRSFQQCPLTTDYAAFLMTLEDIYVGIIPAGGTAIGDAIRTAVSGFDYTSTSDRAILLISDGDNLEGDPLAMRALLKEKGVRLFTIGVGSREGELIPVVDKQGQTTFLKDGEGNIVKTTLNEELLQQMTLGTGGFYLRAAAGDFGVERLVTQGLAELNRSEHESRLIRQKYERFPWFIAVGLLLFSAEALLREQRLLPGDGSA